MKICIDAGHGGKDSGAVNGSIYEKDIALQIALKVKEELSKYNCNVVMSRNTDSYMSPLQKAYFSNNAKCDVFVSIHCNSAENFKAKGTETWYYTGSTEGRKLAEKIQLNLLTVNPYKRAEMVKSHKSLTVLKYTDCTAVLVEVGFLSNNEEMSRLIKSDYQTEIAKAIVKGIVSYYDISLKNNSDFEKARLKMIELGITDGTRPNDYMTRQQAWAMLYRLYNLMNK